jgi:molybdopterin/thiamine biosynthesis adenylyltransferase
MATSVGNWVASAPTYTPPEEDSLRSRFSALSWASEQVLQVPIMLVGLGGIGSWTALFLGRIGYKHMNVWDNDRVERHNIGGQLYDVNQIGQPKATATQNIVARLCNLSIRSYNARFEGTHELNSSIVICAVDNMETRKHLFNRWKELVQVRGYKVGEHTAALFIDGRLLAEQSQVYFVTPDGDKIERYEKTLFLDNEVEPEICSNKQTTHFAANIAANIVKGLNNYMSILVEEDCARIMPFFIEEEGFLLTQKVEL